jgi:hypothetical protein
LPHNTSLLLEYGIGYSFFGCYHGTENTACQNTCKRLGYSNPAFWIITGNICNPHFNNKLLREVVLFDNPTPLWLCWFYILIIA